MVSLVSSVLFSSPASSLMTIDLNSCLDTLLVSVLKSLAVTSYWSSFCGEFLHLILAKFLSFVCYESLLYLSPAPENNAVLKKRGNILSRAWYFRKCFWCMVCALCCWILAALLHWSVLCRVSPFLQWGVFGPLSRCALISLLKKAWKKGKKEKGK